MIKNFILTTSFRPNGEQLHRAKSLAETFAVPYLERKKQGLSHLIGEGSGALVVYKDRLVYMHQDGKRLAFHPDTAMLRIKGSHDPLLEVIGTGSKRVLDATMGMANDSLVMAFAGHEVTAVEADPLIHLLISQGLASYVADYTPINPIMRSIRTHCRDSLSYMREQADKSFDVVYFDPMFSQELSSSPDFSGLRGLADYSPLTEKMLIEAKRVAKERIIIKAHYKDPVFETFGFERQVRSSAKFHYGYLDL